MVECQVQDGCTWSGQIQQANSTSQVVWKRINSQGITDVVRRWFSKVVCPSCLSCFVNSKLFSNFSYGFNVFVNLCLTHPEVRYSILLHSFIGPWLCQYHSQRGFRMDFVIILQSNFQIRFLIYFNIILRRKILNFSLISYISL